MPTLLNLPPEVRLQIYDHVLNGLSLYIGLKFFKSDETTEGSGYYGYSAHLGTSLKPESRAMLSLPQTCRQIYNEFSRHSRPNLPVVLSRVAGYGVPCSYQEMLSTSSVPAGAVTDPWSLLHPDHLENLRHLTLTNRGYGQHLSSEHEGLIGHYPRQTDLFDPTGSFMRVAENVCARFPSLRNLTLAPYVYPDAYTDFSHDELSEAWDDFGHLQRLLESARGIPVFRSYVQKSMDTISALGFCNGSKNPVKLDLDIAYCEFHANVKQRPTDNFPHVLGNDLWWTDQADEKGWYLSTEREIRDTVLVAKAKKGPKGRGVVDIRCTDGWIQCHSRHDGGARWAFVDFPGLPARREVSPRQYIEERGYDIPAWLPEEQRKTLNITYQPRSNDGDYLHREILRRHSAIKVKWLAETGAAFPPKRIEYCVIEGDVDRLFPDAPGRPADDDDEDEDDDDASFDGSDDALDSDVDEEFCDDLTKMYASYLLFELWAAGMHDRARDLPVVRDEEIVAFIMGE